MIQSYQSRLTEECIMQNYATRSDLIEKIIKSLNLTRTLYVSSILIGEPYTGKRTLVRTLFPDLPVADGRDQEAVEKLLEETDALVIEQYEKLPNADRLEFDNKHIIAIANYAGNTRALDEKFAFIYTIPPLRERPEDIRLYTQIYQKEAQETLLTNTPITLNKHELDIDQNLRSLRASIYREILLQSSDKKALERGLHHYFIETLPEDAEYRHHLGLFEKPLLEAGLEIYGSQIKLAEALGINRNTLRKKIHEHL
jgi:DNA-binding protein Fis